MQDIIGGTPWETVTLTTLGKIHEMLFRVHFTLKLKILYHKM